VTYFAYRKQPGGRSRLSPKYHDDVYFGGALRLAHGAIA
jgi:hypothetical protein